MTMIPYKTALIVGAGPGISASLTRALRREGIAVALAARDGDKLSGLVAETGARAFNTDAADPAAVEHLFAAVDAAIGPPDLVVYNPSRRVPGALADLDPEAVRDALMVSAFGAFLVARQAARRMLPNRHGAILLTGASAGRKGFPKSAAFAMGKFALRGLAESTARELGPQGIHVVHMVVDGVVRSAARPDPAERPDSTLDPDAVAAAYLATLAQHRSAWSFEVEIRPWVETF